MSGSSKTSRRLFLVVAVLVAVGALAFVAFGNIGQNLVYYWNPTQLVEAGSKGVGATVRLGGMVKGGTVEWQAEDKALDFVVTDYKTDVRVHATAAPPQMFRENIGVVVEGTMTAEGVFTSDRLMVKHSNEYRAPHDGGDVTQLSETLEEQ